MRQCFQEVVRGKSVPWLGRWAVRCHSGSGELRGLPKGLRLSEAEDWLGREASRPSEDPGGLLYRKQAMAKKMEPRTLYPSPAMSRYQLMAEFWYTKQEPCWPHWSCQSRHALSITQPKAMGPGMLPRVLTTIHWIPSAKDLC